MGHLWLAHCRDHACLDEYRNDTMGHRHSGHVLLSARSLALCSSGADALQPP